jgi:acyl-CoA thioesterase FadM
MVYQERLGTPMVKLQADFLSPSQIGEVLRLSLTVRRIGNSSLELEGLAQSG